MEDETRTGQLSAQLAPGVRIAHYQILSSLGSGGMGQVCLAVDTRLGRKVAIKVLRNTLDRKSSGVQRFLQEARTASALNHPNIVTVYENGECVLGLYIAMELVEGVTLRTLIRKGVAVVEMAELAVQAARAIAVAHAAGIVHRDLKPENIMVRPDGYLKVLDFGLARLTARDQDDTATAEGTVLGTLKYMSPEQGAGEPVDKPSDIFSLGLVFYELATGRHPFQSDSPLAVYRAIATETPLPPSRVNPAIPDALDLLIEGMLAKHPSLRPSAQEVVDALSAWRSGQQLVPRTLVAMPSRPARQFVGRENQRAQLMAAFRAAAAGTGALVCVPGEPGIGKTAFVEDFLHLLSESGEACAIGRGGCSERLGGTDAYLPLLEALDGLRRFDPTHWVEGAMRQFAPSWLQQLVSDPGSSFDSIVEKRAINQEKLRLEVSQLFQNLAREKPLLIFFDDLHWADLSTVEVIAQLANHLREMGLLVVVTYRESEMQVSRHPFLKLKLDLTARGICQEIRLDYLGRREVERYLALRFPGSSFPSDFCARLHARTEGHPLFVADLAGYLRDHRAIVEENGGWAVTPLFAETEKQLPESVRSMIELKITQVPEEDIRILMAASVQGLEFDSAVVAEAAAVDPETLEESMERLERVHSLVRVVEERDMPDRTLSCRYRFVHALYQNSLYAKLRPTRRASLCGLMAQSLTRFWGERKGEIASDLARLFEGARDYARAAEFYLAAARNSAALFAHREAALLARRGLEMVKALPASPESGRLELPLQLVLGGSIALTGGYVVPEVKACFTRATDLTAAAGSSVALFPALWGQSFYYHVTADCAESRKLGDQMLRLAESGHDQLLLPAAHFARALVWELEGNHTAVLQQSGEVMRLAPDPAAGHRGRVARFMVDPVISAYGQHARSLCFLGHYSRCQAQLDRLLTIAASERFDPRSRSDAIISVCVCHQAMGNASEISGLAAKGLDLCDKHELFMERHMTGWMLGWALSMTGSAAEGIHQMRACKGLFGAIGIRMFVETQLSANLAEALLLAGEPDEARTVIDAALAFAHSSGHRYFEPELLRIQGEIAAAAGDAEKARDWFRQSADLAREQRTATFELKTALSLGRLLMAAGKRAEAKAAVAAVYHSLTADSQKVDSSFETADLRTAAEALGS